MHNKNNKRKAGYTIIETMIAVSLFIVVVMAGMGSLLNANLLHNKSQDMRSIMDNLSFIMEDMSKNLRTGYDYHCIEKSSSGNIELYDLDEPENGNDCRGIAFEYQYGNIGPNDQWVFVISDPFPGSNLGKISKLTQSPYNDFNKYIRLTSEKEVIIDGGKSGFIVSGAEKTDNQQPFVTIRLVGEINLKGVVTPFSLQTSVSQRKLDRKLD